LSKKLKIGITGGIGSGKSTFCDFLKAEKYPVLYADDIAKSLMSTNDEIIRAIQSAFGEQSYRENELQRDYLSREVFSNPEKLQQLNAIVHPAVIRESAILLDAALREHDLVFYEAALIFEAHMENLFDYVILLTAPQEKRINRISVRDNTSEEKILSRMRNQMSDEIKKDKADLVILNDGSIEDLQSKVKFAISILSTIPT